MEEPPPFPPHSAPPPEAPFRADALLAHLGLVQSRSQARDLIRAGRVMLNGEPIRKPSQTLHGKDRPEVWEPRPYVSRAGEKLAAWLDHFTPPVKGGQGLDIGASTGGFTDCLLQRGAVAITCLDVGRDQLHPDLRRDPRVHNLEGFNARTLDDVDLPFKTYNFVVMDVSFISLTLVLPAAWRRLAAGGWLFALVKPQFEVGRDGLGRDGVVRDEETRKGALAKIQSFANQELKNADKIGILESPLAGGDGNREFLQGWLKSQSRTPT